MPPDPRVHVGVGAVVERDNCLLMLRRAGVGAFASDGHGTWAVPGGWLDFGEMPASAAMREVSEETGIAVFSQGHLDWVSCAPSESCEFQIVTLYVRCEYVDGEPRVMEPDKCPEVRWVPWPEVRKLPLFTPTRALIQKLQGLTP